MDLMLLIQLVLFVILMGLSGFFSSSETSLFSLNETHIEQMRRDEDPHLSLIERLLSEPRRLIVTILIGNEFVNVAASVISAVIVINLLGAESKFINLFIMIPILLLFGEITPKTLAIRNNKAFASFQSRPIEFFARLITPLRWAVRLVADWITTQVVGKERARGNIVTEDMLRVLAHEAVGEGVLDKAEAQYIDQIFDFGNRTVGDVMTPRSQIIFFSEDMPLEQMVDHFRQTRHTKVPVFKKAKRDSVAGILYARDLLGLDLKKLSQKRKRVWKLLREPLFVSEFKSASDLFYTLRKHKQSLALAVDEYGGVTGLITMEDLLEVIFGEILSPSELQVQASLENLPDGSMQVEATMSLKKFNRAFGQEFVDDNVETVGGLILARLEMLPSEETQIILGDLEIRVLEISHNHIQTLSVKKIDHNKTPKETSAENMENSVQKGAQHTSDQDDKSQSEDLVGQSSEEK
ncbi:MAG: HlyC/CorC family transporter [Gammaproteobacteria bacterium]|nr:HlyC/CorC family transporter [Gammaproteobacteria bacterium]